jgi:hypothetical protein
MWLLLIAGNGSGTKLLLNSVQASFPNTHTHTHTHTYTYMHVVYVSDHILNE